MTAADYMAQVETLRVQMEINKAEISHLRGLPSGGGTANEITALDNDTRALAAAEAEVLTVIKALKPKYCKLLYKRYFLSEPWDKIARDMGYTVQWINTLHRRALREVERRLKK